MRYVLLPALLCLAACATRPPEAPAAQPGMAVHLSQGEAVTLPDRAGLRYVAIRNDSRCPPDVQCIRAGDADAVFEYRPAGAAAREVVVNTARPATALAPGWTLTLLSLGAGARGAADVRIDPAPR